MGITFYCGIPQAEQSAFNYADMTQMSIPFNLIFNVAPSLLGFGCPTLAASLKIFGDKSNPMLQPTAEWMSMSNPSPAFNNTPEGRELEIPSAGMYANARSMAKINAALAGGGAFENIRLLSPEALKRSLDKVQAVNDAAFFTTFGFTQGKLK